MTKSVFSREWSINRNIEARFDGRSNEMKPDQIYQDLKDLAEKLDVTVSEQSFRASGFPVRSGACLIKGKMHCIIDRNIGLQGKIKVLAKNLVNLAHEKHLCEARSQGRDP